MPIYAKIVARYDDVLPPCSCTDVNVTMCSRRHVSARLLLTVYVFAAGMGAGSELLCGMNSSFCRMGKTSSAGARSFV